MKAINDWKKGVRSAFIHGDMGIGQVLSERENALESTVTNIQQYI